MKKLLLIVVTMGLTIASASTALASGWTKDENGWWFQYDDGTYAKGALRNINGQDYIFNTDGYMLTDWQYYNWGWYYLDGSGLVCKGWQSINNKWYYFDEEGRMQTGWLNVGGDSYFLKEDGSMATKDFEFDGLWYSPDPVTGNMQKSKRNTSNKNLRYNEDGTVERRNAEGEWEYLPSKEDLGEAQMEAMKKDYFNLKYTSKEQFENDARTNLTGFVDSVEIEDFIFSVEDEYDSTYEDNSWRYDWYN